MATGSLFCSFSEIIIDLDFISLFNKDKIQRYFFNKKLFLLNEHTKTM